VSEHTDSRARSILQGNDKGGFTVPTAGLYPYQWNWDSVFVALGFATFDEARACEEIETLFEAQWADGFVPHIIFRSDDPDYFPGPSVWQANGELPTSGITQPPVAATVIRALWESTANADVKARLEALYPKVVAWHRWFHSCRIPSESGAVTIVHPWESGRDNSPEWDGPASAVDVSQVQPYRRRDLQHADADMRPTKEDYDRYIALVEYGRSTGWNHELIGTDGPFRVADVGMTMILLRAARDVRDFAGELGRNEDFEELDGHIRLLESGAEYLWDPTSGTYCSRDTITGRSSGFVTNASFLYCYAGVGSEQQHEQMTAHWERIQTKMRYMMPSHDPDEKHFDHKRYWRGPIWIVVNYMLALGFEERGLQSRAQRIRNDSRALIDKFGFCEAFSPVTGAGTGGKDFSWTAAMWLAWCGDGD
jgi:hypothetical protein